jgi:H+/gluconate symporter-like permease
MGLLGILLGLGLLVAFAFRGWSVLLLAPAAALIAAAFSGEPLLAHWTQTFMEAAAGFLAQFFPLFLLGAIFGKLMEDSGAVSAIAKIMSERLGSHRAILAVVLAGAFVTYGGVSLFVAFFVLAPMAQSLFRVAGVPGRLMPAAIALGTSTFTMSALPGTPSIQNAIPMPFFGTTTFAAPGLASSPPLSCWASACGGSAAPKPRLAARVKAMERIWRREPSKGLRIRPCATARPLQAPSTRLNSATVIAARFCRHPGWRRCP